MFFKFFKRNKSKNKVVSEVNSSGNVFVDEKYTPGEGDFISSRFEIKKSILKNKRKGIRWLNINSLKNY